MTMDMDITHARDDGAKRGDSTHIASGNAWKMTTVPAAWPVATAKREKNPDLSRKT
jgi:hypothetical protein